MKNEFDNNLTDKGWQTMNRLLEREMPEQRRRRRFAWWLLALLLLPLVSAGGWWLFQPSKPVSVPPPPVEKPKVSEPVASTQDLIPNAFGKKLSNLPDVVGVPANNEQQDVIPNDKHHTLVQPLTSRQVGIGRDTNNGQKNFQEVELTYSSDDSKSSDESKAGTYSSGDSKSSDELNLLPVSLQFVENEIKNTPRPSVVASFAAAITKKNAEPKRWHFGLAAGLASENFSALNGFSAGAAVDWQFARKWGLRSGLQYAQYNLSASERPIVALDANIYADATENIINLGSGSPISDPLTPKVLVQVERLRQLEMPLLAYWQPVRPLRVFGGFSTAYKLSAQASQESFANNQFYYATTQEARKNLNELAANTLSRWQVSWQAGAGVRIGRHFELDVFYKNGLGSKGNSADAQSFDPNLSPDLMWQPRNAGASHYFLFNGIWFF